MVTVLDGGLATTLEAAGHDLSDALWSARLLRDDPAAIVGAHRAFVDAGAQVVTSASYQASYDGFASAGVDRAGTDVLLRLSTRLAREGADGRALVAASVGPYGAAMADGSEYRGDYGVLGVDLLRRFHHDRLRVLVDSGPDLLALETVPCLAEVEALIAEVEGLGVPAWLSVTCVGDRLRSGELAAQAFSLARGHAALVAIGTNCTSPAAAGALVAVAARESGLPVVVYPNSGERWDATARQWVGESGVDPTAVRGWVDAGAAYVGGCCRVGPAEVRALTAALDDTDPPAR